MKQVLFLLFVVLSVYESTAQGFLKDTISRKGKAYFYWGWNRGAYTDSDIEFKGDNYEFTLSDVVAKDRQTPFQWDIYAHPGLITIPQTNMRLGYFINDRYDVSIGVDHMKYVVQEDQVVEIDGEINDGTPFDKVYNKEQIALSDDFLTFEHTDGLNYINVELGRSDLIYKSPDGKVWFDWVNGAGAGFMLPKTNVSLLGGRRHDDFNVAGYGLGARTGVRGVFFKNVLLQTDLKGGFINMPNIRTTHDTSDTASQHFFFVEWQFQLGLMLQVFKDK